MTLLNPSLRPSSTGLMRSLLEAPGLSKAIRALPPEALGRLIDTVGLEDCGEIIALASTEQLLRVFDEELWKNERPGAEEEFDDERFVLWLEILTEAGEIALAERLAELPEDLVFLAFSRRMLVLNLDDLAAAANPDEEDVTDKVLESALSHEFDEYGIVGLGERGWDTILTALIALDDRQPDLLRRILSHCCYASSEVIEENGGLYNVLTAEEMLFEDAAADRADRRAAKGHVAPSDAAAFLRLAEVTDLSAIIDDEDQDPVTRAYFREIAEVKDSRNADLARNENGNNTIAGRLGRQLKEAGVWPPPTPLLSETEAAPTVSDRLRAALLALAETRPDRHDRRMRELAYLANLFLAGRGSAYSPIRPLDAAREVLDVCAEGLAFLIGRKQERRPPEVLLADTGADKLFRIGWRLRRK